MSKRFFCYVVWPILELINLIADFFFGLNFGQPTTWCSFIWVWRLWTRGDWGVGKALLYIHTLKKKQPASNRKHNSHGSRYSIVVVWARENDQQPGELISLTNTGNEKHQSLNPIELLN